MTITLFGDIPALIGPTLRRIRKSQGKTLKDISEATGYSVSHISEVERGVHGASVETLMVWAGVLGYRVTIQLGVMK